jgi:uncharacterized delta-60 repeat protein
MKRALFGFIVCLFSVAAIAQDPNPDATFDLDGYRATPRDCTDYTSGTAVCVQSDGKILVAGMSAPQSSIARVVRYHTDGATDFSFGINGVAEIDLSGATGGTCEVHDMKLQSDGKIVIAGQGRVPGPNAAIAVARFDSTGLPDVTFDNDGLVLANGITGCDDRAQALAIQANGKLITVGYVFDGNNCQLHVHRFNSDGSDDATLDGDGKILLNSATYNTFGRGVAIQPDGKIVVVGDRTYTSRDAAVWRFTASGAPDGNFDNDGVAYYNFGGTEELSAVAVQADGKLVFGGFHAYFVNFLVMRVHPSGMLDSSFSNDGYISIDFAGQDDFLEELSIQPDDKILCVGYGTNGSAQMARLYTNGDYDPNFDFDGKYSSGFEGYANFHGHTFQQDGKLLVCGTTNNSPVNYLLVARYKIDYEVGIHESAQSEFSVSPNPFTTSFIIRHGSSVNDAVLNLYNATGTLVRSEIVRGPSAVIDRGDLTAGMYIAELLEENGNASRAVIVAFRE